jgi:hypothetical protein
MDGIEITHAIATVFAVEVGGIEHVVAQMPHEQLLVEIAVEGFGQELVLPYFR